MLAGLIWRILDECAAEEAVSKAAEAKEFAAKRAAAWVKVMERGDITPVRRSARTVRTSP